MKLIRYLQTTMDEGFMLNNFKTCLLDYLRVTTSVLNIASPIELKERVQKCEDNCTSVSGRKVKLDIQRIVPSSSRSCSTFQKEQRVDTNRRPYRSKCQRYGHKEARCWKTTPNSKNTTLEPEHKNTVGMNEVYM
jgi:hypothetical protein